MYALLSVSSPLDSLYITTYDIVASLYIYKEAPLPL